MKQELIADLVSQKTLLAEINLMLKKQTFELTASTGSLQSEILEKNKKIPSNMREDLCFIIKDDNELLLFLGDVSRTSTDIAALHTDSVSIIYPLIYLFENVRPAFMNIKRVARNNLVET